MEGFKSFLTVHLKKKFKVIPPQTLFELDMSVLNTKNCPLCLNKLKKTKKGLWICNSKKHRTPFATKKV